MIVLVVTIVTWSIFTRNASPEDEVKLMKILVAVSRPSARSAIVRISEYASAEAPENKIDDGIRIVPAEGKADGEAGGKFDDKRGALGD
jgi:hypothetical protein